jgi:hypothetical protein
VNLLCDDEQKQLSRAISWLFFFSLFFVLFIYYNMSSEQQARDLIAQAQKKLNSWSFFGPSNKCEDAAELYEKAGNMFKLAQQCKIYICHLRFYND